ncbi:10640_t:CDS:2, partial [Gigaspora rosea]
MSFLVSIEFALLERYKMDDTNFNAILDIYLSSLSDTHASERTTNDLTCASNFNDLSASSSSLQFQGFERTINDPTCASNFYDLNASLSYLPPQFQAFEQAMNTADTNYEDAFYVINAFPSLSSSSQTSEKTNNVEIECESTFHKDINACSSSQIQTSEEINSIEMECESNFYEDINASFSSLQIQAFESSMNLSDTVLYDD